MSEQKDSYLTILKKLTKFSISFPVVLSAMTGYMAGYGGISAGIIPLAVGGLMLASAASALNQIQERNSDLLMGRTSKRPLPSGQISLQSAVIWMVSLAISGIAILWLFCGWLPAVLGIINMFWYNGIYTPLKKITPFAIIPGGVVGALPPVIGWVAAGGGLFHPAAWVIAFVFFAGQVPHFLFLVLKYGKQYENAGYKSLTAIYSDERIRRMTFIWTLATGLSAIALPLFYDFFHRISDYLLWLMSVLLIVKFLPLLKPPKEDPKYISSFLLINFYFLALMALIAIDVLI